MAKRFMTLRTLLGFQFSLKTYYSYSSMLLAYLRIEKDSYPLFTSNILTG